VAKKIPTRPPPFRDKMSRPAIDPTLLVPADVIVVQDFAAGRFAAVGVHAIVVDVDKRSDPNTYTIEVQSVDPEIRYEDNTRAEIAQLEALASQVLIIPVTAFSSVHRFANIITNP